MDIAAIASQSAASNVQMAASLAVLKQAMTLQSATGAALVASLAPVAAGAAQDTAAISQQAMAALMAEMGG